MPAIVSSARNFVFVHVYKNAGSSITEVLKPHGDLPPRLDDRLRRCRWIGESGLHIGKFHFFCNHASASEIRAELGGDRFDKMFSFGFVRNPWSRLVSLYHYKRVAIDASGTRRFTTSFEDWIAQLPHAPDKPPPQMHFLFSNEGKQLVSYIGRFEKLPRDLGYIGDRIGVSFTSLGHLNATRHGHYRDYYDPRSREVVRRLFAPDIERFGYEF